MQLLALSIFFFINKYILQTQGYRIASARFMDSIDGANSVI